MWGCERRWRGGSCCAVGLRTFKRVCVEGFLLYAVQDVLYSLCVHRDTNERSDARKVSRGQVWEIPLRMIRSSLPLSIILITSS